MRLVDLSPNWVGAGGEGISDAQGNPVPERHGVGITFCCPGCSDEAHKWCFVPFSNPLDGGPQHELQGWQRTGDTFETLTLTPSIQRLEGCKWHGFITNGEIITC